MMKSLFVLSLLLAVAVTVRADADPVADYPEGTKDFTLHLKDPANRVNKGTGGEIYAANSKTFPALKTQGLSWAYPFLQPGGEHLPHWHLRASELLFVIKGQIEVVFIDSAKNVFKNVLGPYDTIIIPRGVAHSVRNVGNSPSENISAFNSENPGTQVLSTWLLLFPTINSSPALQLSEADVRKLNNTAYVAGITPVAPFKGGQGRRKL